MSTFKLYYTPTSCGAASFLTATLGGLEFDSEVVDLRTHKTKSGADFYAINPKGNVPTIAFPDGSILNEYVAALTGKYLNSAKTTLKDTGLELGEIRRTEHAEHGENYVLRQDPAPGSKVPFGTVVNLTVVAPN